MASYLRGRLGVARGRLRLPPPTLRLRLTALYSSLFLAAGAALLAFTYLLVERSTPVALFVNNKNGSKYLLKGSPSNLSQRVAHPPASLTERELDLARQLGLQAVNQHAKDLHSLLTQSGIALAVMAGLAIALGWLVAGRVLQPLRDMTAATRQMTERNLHERLALPGPADEVKDLADTIDGLLARLEKAFDAQRRFVANASHELRTPLTYDRALLEVALADPGATVSDLRAACEDLLVSGEQKERLIEALLTLASSERELDRHEWFNLAVVAERAVSLHGGDADRRGLGMGLSLSPAGTVGNPDLVESMAANLIDNAIRHNVPGGRLDVRTAASGQHAVLAVSNTGPVVPQSEVDRLIQPFQRLGADRVSHPDGHGLGLSIVRAIALAHDADLMVTPRPEGGLTVEARFPLRPPPRARDRRVAGAAQRTRSLDSAHME